VANVDRAELILGVSRALGTDPARSRDIVNAFETFFVARLLAKLSSVSLKEFIKTKNPYLYRASGISKCNDLVDRAFRDYISASVETYFGPVFEAVARLMSGGTKPAGGGEIDLDIRYNGHADLFVMKSGPKGFNKSSRKRAHDELAAAAGKLAHDGTSVRKFIAYAYGRKRTTRQGDVIHLASRDFWERITGDNAFYSRMLDACGAMAPLYAADLDAPRVRLLQEAHSLLCDGDQIDWSRVLEIISG